MSRIPNRRCATGSCLGVLLLIILSAASCGEPASWSDALEQTAPPNPERGEVVAQEQAVESDEQPREEESESSSRSEGDADLSGRPEEQAEPEDLGASLLVVLRGDPDCYAGLVRCYVDGRFVGQVGEDRRLRVAVSPGRHFIEIWDSLGRWEVEVVAVSGQTAGVNVNCNESRGTGEY